MNTLEIKQELNPETSELPKHGFFPRELEDEAIYIMREVAAQFEKPALLFSGGKDSITLVRLAQKAFYPGKIPFPLVHVDTGHNFPETVAFRDWLAKETGAELIVRYVQDSINQGKVKEETGKYASRNALQTVTLLDAIEEFKFDACIGGARRDEEKARAKERIFSVQPLGNSKFTFSTVSNIVFTADSLILLFVFNG